MADLHAFYRIIELLSLLCLSTKLVVSLLLIILSSVWTRLSSSLSLLISVWDFSSASLLSLLKASISLDLSSLWFAMIYSLSLLPLSIIWIFSVLYSSWSLAFSLMNWSMYSFFSLLNWSVTSFNYELCYSSKEDFSEIASCFYLLNSLLWSSIRRFFSLACSSSNFLTWALCSSMSCWRSVFFWFVKLLVYRPVSSNKSSLSLVASSNFL